MSIFRGSGRIGTFIGISKCAVVNSPSQGVVLNEKTKRFVENHKTMGCHIGAAIWNDLVINFTTNWGAV